MSARCVLPIFAIVVLVFVQHSAYSDAYGTHGMVIMKVDDQLLASHLPLNNSMHAHQILIQIDLEKNNKKMLGQLLSAQTLVTLEPEKFNLHTLTNNELKVFNADIYAGHFERQGKKKMRGVRITIKKILLNETITQSKNGHYYIVDIEKNSHLLVHQIASNPSFDQIIQVNSTSSIPANTIIKLNNKQPLTKAVFEKYSTEHSLMWKRELYTETQDFLAL